MIRAFSLLLVLVTLASCSPTLKLLTGVKNPKVRSDAKANELLKKLPDTTGVYDAYFKDLTEPEDIVFNLAKGLSSAAHVYDKEGYLLCYQGDSFCGGEVLTQTENNTIESLYQRCDSTEIDVISAPLKLQDLHKTIAFEDKVPGAATYTVVFFWSYDLARRDHLDNWLDVHESFLSKEDVVYYRVNTDLRSSWNLPEGKKGRTKFKKDGDAFEMTITVPFYEE